jgi:glycosyltransferase involved in cell wall biosynthesis
MVKLTVGLITKRSEPRLDMTLRALKGQTFTDFEYIVVDGYYSRPRRKEYVEKLVKNIVGNKFPVLHIPDKASRWRGQRPCIANARNTVLLFANGKYVVHADDCCKQRSNWLERHVAILDKGYMSAGSWIGCQNSGPNDECLEGIYGPEDRLKNWHSGVGEVNNRWLYGGNFGYIVEAALQINGFDEIYDGEVGLEDMDFGERLARKGYKTMFDSQCLVEYHMSSHRYDKMVPPVEKKLRSGVYHFSNEFAMEDLVLREKDRSWTKGNTVNIRGSREIFGAGNGFDKYRYPMEQMLEMTKSWIDGNKYDWRDGKLISEKLANEPKWE